MPLGRWQRPQTDAALEMQLVADEGETRQLAGVEVANERQLVAVVVAQAQLDLVMVQAQLAVVVAQGQLAAVGVEQVQFAAVVVAQAQDGNTLTVLRTALLMPHSSFPQKAHSTCEAYLSPCGGSCFAPPQEEHRCSRLQ